MSEPTPHLTAFGLALEDELQRAGRKNAWLAAQLEVSPQLVSNWTKGEREPLPRTAVKVEEVLDAAPGTLTRHLGYLPIAAAGEIIEFSVIDAILADPQLDEDSRRVMLGAYSGVTRVRRR